MPQTKPLTPLTDEFQLRDHEHSKENVYDFARELEAKLAEAETQRAKLLQSSLREIHELDARHGAELAGLSAAMHPFRGEEESITDAMRRLAMAHEAALGGIEPNEEPKAQEEPKASVFANFSTPLL